jgi:hypothetical protein
MTVGWSVVTHVSIRAGFEIHRSPATGPDILRRVPFEERGDK